METRVGAEPVDKLQLAMDRTFMVREAMQSGVRPFSGLQDAYIRITGDRLFESLRGVKSVSEMTAREATIVMGDFPNILLNSMTKKLIQDYAEPMYAWLDNLVTYVDIADFKSQDRVRMGYLSDLAPVVEDAPYVDFAKPTDEKISYAPTKRGNTLSVSRETILSDDLHKLTRWPTLAARAARRTLAQFVLNFFINNPNYGGDNVALFHANHSNLGANALSIPELTAAEIALAAQTEKDSGKPLELTLDWLLVPRAIYAAAVQINQAQFYNPGPAIQVPNPFWKRFGENNERIFVTGLLDMVDTDDWYCGTLPSIAPFIEVGFVRGQREPEIIMQSSDTVGAVFTNDRITFKIRHEYGGAPVDYRPIRKNAVA